MSLWKCSEDVQCEQAIMAVEFESLDFRAVSAETSSNLGAGRDSGQHLVFGNNRKFSLDVCSA